MKSLHYKTREGKAKKVKAPVQASPFFYWFFLSIQPYLKRLYALNIFNSLEPSRHFGRPKKTSNDNGFSTSRLLRCGVNRILLRSLWYPFAGVKVSSFVLEIKKRPTHPDGLRHMNLCIVFMNFQ